MQFLKLLLALCCLSVSNVHADSSFPRSPGPHTYPGTVPDDCNVIDATISLEKWLSYEGPFMDMDVPWDPTCLISRVYHPIIHVTVSMMCGEGLRTIEWRFQGGGDSGQPIRELGNEVPPHKLRTLTPLEFHGFPMTVSGADFTNFLKTYNEKIRDGKLGTYSWNPDDYDCSNELNCGGYFLIVLKELVKGYIIEESTDELAEELSKDLGPCDHFAWELGGDPELYDEALDPPLPAGNGDDACDEVDHSSSWEGHCYLGPNGKCFEDPTATLCNGAVQSTNEFAPCYLAPEETPVVEPTPLACAGAAQSTNPNAVCYIETTSDIPVPPGPAECSGAAQSDNPRGACYVPPIVTPIATLSPKHCSGVTQSSDSTAACYVAPSGGNPATPTPNVCAGQTQSANPNAPCYVPMPTIIPSTPGPVLCNGMTQSNRPNAPCYLALEQAPEAAPTPLLCLGKTQSNNPKAPCYVAPQSM